MTSHWPKRWRATRLKYESSLKGRLGWQGLKAEEYRDEGPHVVSSAHFQDQRVQWHQCPRVSMERYLLDDNIQLAPQDVLLMKDGAALGKLAYVEELPGPACLNSHLLLLRPRRGAYSPRFFFYVATTGVFQDYMQVYGTGATFMGVSQRDIGNFPIAFPALEEQTQIAKFLDYETAKIDALIEKQQQLIALLKEKRQAVISHAVTKGLNPDAPLRDSGIEWLGKVPAHWEVMNLNRVVDTFVDYRGRTPEKTEDGRPLVTAGAVRNGVVDLDRAPQFVSEATYHQLRQRGVPEVGDLLFTSEAPLGEVAMVEDVDIACAQRIIMFKVNRRRMRPAFLWLYLRAQAGQDEILTKASGSTAEGIRADRLRRTRVLVPVLEEQERIVAHVQHELSGFDSILDATDRQMVLLQERRTALISAAVTGKIDVRGWKAPESAAEAEVA